MDTKILEGIGLTKGEVTVYLTLLEQGSSTAGSIIKKAFIQNSVFHFNVNRLMDKGLVSYVKKGKYRIYKAVSPKNLILYLRDKEKELISILPELQSKQEKIREVEEAEVFNGINGIISLLNILIEDTKRGDEFLFFAPDISEKNEDIQKFYEMYDAKRKAKGLLTKGLASIKLKDLFIKRAYLKMKYVNIPMPANMAFCKDKMAIISWPERPVGILIKSRQIVEKQKEFFNTIWNNTRIS